jgi:hypothetical protein
MKRAATEVIRTRDGQCLWNKSDVFIAVVNIERCFIGISAVMREARKTQVFIIVQLY